MEQLFLTILNRAVTAGWLVLLVMVLRVVLKKAPRAAHYGLWAIVAVRLLWPGDLLPRTGVSLVPTTEPISGDVLTAAGTAVSGGLPAVSSPAGAAAAETAARTGQSLGHIAAVVWLVGMAAMALYLAGSYVRLRVRLRTAVRLEDGVWESEQAASPFVLGFFRPRIYLPFGLDRGIRDYVLAHERTHIRHRDHWVKPLAFLLLAVYWFNPLLWAAYILLCRDMEYACDEAVLRDLEEPDKRAYSQALLNCAAPRRAVTACPVAFGETCVKGRIRRALRYKKPAVWVTVAAVAVCAAAAVCLLTNPKDRTPYRWASRVTAEGLNVTYLWEGTSAQTPAGMSGLTSRLAEQLNGLTEEDLPLLENYAYDILGQGTEPFRLQMGRTAGKRELLYGGDSGYPLMLLYRGKLYGVDSEEMLQTILEYTRGVQVVPAGTELTLRMGLPGVYRMMTKESADGSDVIQGDDFSWTPAAWQGGMAFLNLAQTGRDGYFDFAGRIWCARARWGGQEHWLVYARNGQIALQPTESGSTRLNIVGRGLTFPEGGTYLTAECVYQTPVMSSPSPLSAELLQFRDEAVKYWARYQENASGQLTTALDPGKYSQYSIQGGQSISPEEWNSRFPEGLGPDISGYQERWLFQMEDGRQLLRLDDQLYLLQYYQVTGEIFEMLRLRPVPLEPERVLELDRLLLSVSRDGSAAAVSDIRAVMERLRQLPDYRRLLDGGADTLRYCFTMLECRYNGGYVMQAAMMAACQDLLADMGEDVTPYAGIFSVQAWYDRVKTQAFAVSEDLAHHPGYAVLLGLGVSRPDGTAAIAYVDMDGDGLAESLCTAEGKLRVLRYDGTEVWSSGPVGQNGDEALFLHRNGGQWELLRYGRTAEEQFYELLSLTGGRERLVRSRHLAGGAAAEDVRVFAEDLHTLLYGVDEAGLSDGCEMLLLSVMNGETRVGPLYDFSGYEMGEGNG